MEEISDVRELMRRTRGRQNSRVKIAPTVSSGNRTILDCFVPGKPRPQARPRIGAHGAYSPKSGWYDLLVMAFNAANVQGCPLSEALRVDADFYLPRPARLMTSSYDDGPLWAAVRPDRDNLDKALLDAMTAAKFVVDDGLVVAGEPRKLYHAKRGQPGVRVVVSLAGKPEPIIPREIPT